VRYPQVRHYIRIRSILLALTLSLFLSTDGEARAQACTSQEIKSQIGNLAKDSNLQERAVEALRECGSSAVPDLIQALQDKNDLQMQLGAIKGLEVLGSPAVSDLEKILSDNSKEDDVRALSIVTLTKIAQAHKAERNLIVQLLSKRYQDKNESNLIRVNSTLALETIKSLESNSFTDYLTLWIKQHPKEFAGGTSIVGLLCLYLGIFWFKPLWLLKVDNWLKPASLNISSLNLELSLRPFLALKYSNRVLDEWVRYHLPQVRDSFYKKCKDEKDIDLENYIPLPIQIGNNHEPRILSKEALQPIFDKKRYCILVSAEGGAGKTSLACQIATWVMADTPVQRPCKHRMLPILIDRELDFEPKKCRHPLTDAILGQLQDLVGSDEEISLELLDKLLRQRRILVILDHLSEMSEATRKKIQFDSPELPISALIVTSRLEEKLDIVKTTLNPLRVERDRLLQFMQLYVDRRLEKQGKKYLNYVEYYSACSRLTQIVGERKITVLLAKLYGDQLVDRLTEDQSNVLSSGLPKDIPGLMRSYINRLNRSIPEDRKRDELEVQNDAKIVAWECLRYYYRSDLAKRDDVLSALEAISKEVDAKLRLQYLEKSLRLIRTEEPGDKIRFYLDPLAEYLGALYCVAHFNKYEKRWRQFLDLVPQNKPAEVFRDFLLAVRDVCLLPDNKSLVPDYIPEKLLQKAAVDSEKLEQDIQDRNLWQYYSDLKLRDNAEDVKFAIGKIGDLGGAVRRAVERQIIPNILSDLVKFLEREDICSEVSSTLAKLGSLVIPDLTQTLKHENTYVRCSAAQILGELREESKSAVPNLVAALEDSNLSFRILVITALGKIGLEASLAVPKLINLLRNNNEDIEIRKRAAKALSFMGQKAEQSVDTLEVVLHNNDEVTLMRLVAAQTLFCLGRTVNSFIAEVNENEILIHQFHESITTRVEELGGGINLEMVLIQGNTFLMGSPIEEIDRQEDYENRHQVTLQSFFMSKYPVTQAQWQLIATLPKVDLELNLNPSYFKGANRPVEQVSWLEAKEFCARLSILKSCEYRLPNEAEWEYACRAGTITPFNFGETITTDLANYCGIDRQVGKTLQKGSYASGPKGDYREETTPVGGFCVINKYGLCDMHGNVWEMCSDFWRKDHEDIRSDDKVENNFSIVIRGGAWNSSARECRSAFRTAYKPNSCTKQVGFRVCCSELTI